MSENVLPETAFPHHSFAPPTDRYLGRQPIFDTDGTLFGYELFFRAGATEAFSGDPEVGTREVVDHWLTLVPGSESHVAFLNCTRSALTDGLLLLLPPASTVLEIPPHLAPDSAVIEACRSLKKLGFRIALDHYSPGDPRAAMLDLADLLKIDFPALGFGERQEVYATGRAACLRLLAQKIETETQKRIALAEGCSLFQGYYFAHPVLVASRRVLQNDLVYVQLLSALSESPVDLRRIEQLVSGDPSLCYRVLRVANSARQGRATAVTSVREALLLVGDDAVRRIVAVGMAGALIGSRSTALLAMVLSRARFCEQLAPFLSQDPGELFLLGVVSLLDALLGTTMESILKLLPLSSEMMQALRGEPTVPGRVLELVAALESCDWDACDRLQYLLNLPAGAIAPAYREALQWAAAMLEA